jgi:tight adherence protein B
MNWAILFIALSAFGLLVREILVIRNERRQILREEAWPQFEDIYISGLQSGISVSDTFSFASDFELPVLSDPLKLLVSSLDQGRPLAKALEEFKARVNLAEADLFVAIVSIAQRNGGQNLIQALAEHAKAVRFEVSARGDVRARQNAILSVAKLGLLAPWVLVAVLSVNEQTRNSFNSHLGQGLLVVGFAISFIAYRLVVASGRINSFERIFMAPNV